MRDIKFRIWAGVSMMTYKSSQYTLALDGWICDGDGCSYDEQPPIMQYIGLKDKHGVEIYEGDLVRFGEEPTKLCEDLYMHSIYKIDFYQGSFLRPYIYHSFDGKKFTLHEKNIVNPTGRANLNGSKYDWSKVEVIGNIHENNLIIEK